MKKVVIFGATGSLGTYIIDALTLQKDVHLTLFVRNSNKLDKKYTVENTVIEGDILDYESVRNAVENQDIVYFGLSGDLKTMAKSVVMAMRETGVKRIIAVSSMGIYGASWKATFSRNKNSPGFFNSIVLIHKSALFCLFNKKKKAMEIIDFHHFSLFCLFLKWCHQKVNTIRFTVDNHRFIFSSTGKSTRFGTRLFFTVLPVV